MLLSAIHMDPKSPANPPKKYKFKPKPQILPVPKTEVKTEVVDDVDSTRASELMRQFHERSVKGKAKTEKKIHASQIAFGLGAASTSLKSYNTVRNSSTGGASSSSSKHKEYQEPWDYYSNYPLTLPLRPPYSAILDTRDFGEAIKEEIYDENAISAAEELGLFVSSPHQLSTEIHLFFSSSSQILLQEESVEPTMLFLQLPPSLPTPRSSAPSEDQDTGKESIKSKERNSCLDKLPAGAMGKLLVYKSGAVKLKLGEILYDVSPGMRCAFAQDVVAVNSAEKRFCVVGEIEKRAVVTPDVDSLLENIR